MASNPETVNPNCHVPRVKVDLNDEAKEFVDSYLKEKHVYVQRIGDSTLYITPLEFAFAVNAGGIVSKLYKSKHKVIKLSEDSIVTARDRIWTKLPEAHRSVWGKFHFLPYNWQLPIRMALGTPRLRVPMQDTKNTFIYAPGNILYNGECYAANCKHRVSMWDEHPWCTPCILEKELPTNCVVQCYVCKVMSKDALALRKAEIMRYKAEFEDLGQVKSKAKALRKNCPTQFHADIAESELVCKTKGHNPAWNTDYKGYYKPSTKCPHYMSWSEATSKGLFEGKLDEEVKTQLRAAIDLYRETKENKLRAKEEKAKEEASKKEDDDNENSDAGKSDVESTKQASDVETTTQPSSKRKRKRKRRRKSKSKAEGEESPEAEETEEEIPHKKRKTHRKVAKVFTKETKTLGSWVETSNDKVTVIEYGPRRVTYEFGDCAVAAKAIDPQTRTYIEQPRRLTTKDLMGARARSLLVPSDDVIKRVNKEMYRFADCEQGVYRPDFKKTFKHDFRYPVSNIRETVMENVADRNGKFPTDDCLLFVTQREIRSQEFLLRQQCKALEVAEPLFEAVLNYCRNLSGERDLHFAKVIEGLNQVHRMHLRCSTKLLGRTIQQRVRDQCLRLGLNFEETNDKLSQLLPANDSIYHARNTVI